MNDLKRDGKGELITKIILIPLQQLRITFFSGSGTLLGHPDAEVAATHRFMVEGPGIEQDPYLVKKVTFPTLDYTDNVGEAVAQVELYQLKP